MNDSLLFSSETITGGRVEPIGRARADSGTYEHSGQKPSRDERVGESNGMGICGGLIDATGNVTKLDPKDHET